MTEGTDELYTGGKITVEANHSNGNENCAEGDAERHEAITATGVNIFIQRAAGRTPTTWSSPIPAAPTPTAIIR